MGKKLDPSRVLKGGSGLSNYALIMRGEGNTGPAGKGNFTTIQKKAMGLNDGGMGTKNQMPYKGRKIVGVKKTLKGQPRSISSNMREVLGGKGTPILSGLGNIYQKQKGMRGCEPQFKRVLEGTRRSGFLRKGGRGEDELGGNVHVEGRDLGPVGTGNKHMSKRSMKGRT